MTTLRERAGACGWPEHSIASMEATIKRRSATVLHVDADVIAIRMPLGEMQTDVRHSDLETISRANRALAHLPEYVPPTPRDGLPSLPVTLPAVGHKRSALRSRRRGA